MYAVVGCGDCGALWIVEGRPETTGCPRCGKRHRFDRLRTLAEADDEDAARQARSELLAARGEGDEAFAGVDDFRALGDRIDDAGVSDGEYLGGHGIDADAVAEAAEPDGRTGGGSRRETVLAALRELEAPTEAAVVEYAAARDVPAEYAREALSKLVRAGDATEDGGTYRLL